MRVASRVAINRTIAGVHFAIDSAAGALLGLTLGRYFVQRCRGQTSYEAWGFDSAAFPDPTANNVPPNDGDFYWHEFYDPAADTQTARPYAVSRGSPNIAAATAQSPLRWLWGQARAEWN
jgi:hypothetical protein